MKRKRTKTSIIHVYLIRFFLVVLIAVLGVFAYGLSHPLLISQRDCANSLSCIDDLSGTFNPSLLSGTFMGTAVALSSSLATDNIIKPVLGETTGEDKHIYVDLSTQRLTATQGGKTVFSFLVSTGKWGKTPTGDFRIWIKLRFTRMTGGNPAIGTYYDLPNVPYTMYFYNDQVPKTKGYGLHGAYWHNNFGHPMSHGCVNIAIEDSHRLYDWANPPTAGFTTYASAQNLGTPITIYGVAPSE